MSENIVRKSLIERITKGIASFLSIELVINFVMEAFVGGFMFTIAWLLFISSSFETIEALSLWQGIKFNMFIYFAIIVPIKRNIKNYDRK